MNQGGCSLNKHKKRQGVLSASAAEPYPPVNRDRNAQLILALQATNDISHSHTTFLRIMLCNQWALLTITETVEMIIVLKDATQLPISFNSWEKKTINTLRKSYQGETRGCKQQVYNYELQTVTM